MTLPTGQLTMAQIANELGLGLAGLSLQHGWVRALAQVSGPANSFNNLRGKTGRFDGNAFNNGSNTLSLGGLPWFGGTLGTLSFANPPPGFPFSGTFLQFNTQPNWGGNILVRNNSTGGALILNPNAGGQASVWGTPNLGLIRGSGSNDNFTILPST